MADASSTGPRQARGRALAAWGWAALVLGAGLLGAACPPSSGPCTADQDCGTGALCVDGTCRRACNSDVDCTGRERCADGVCLPESQARDAARLDSAVADTASVDAAAPDAITADQGSGDALLVDGGAGADAMAGVDASTPDSRPLQDAPLTDRAVAMDRGVLSDASAPDAAVGADRVVDAAGVDGAAADGAAVDVPATDGTAADHLFTDAASVDAPGADSGGGSAICGTVDLMADDFDDGVADWRWYPWATSGTRVSETLGHLSIVLAANLAGDAYAGYNAGQHTSLLGRALTVELVQGVSSTGSAQASLIFRRDRDHQLTITQTGSSLRARHTVDGIASTGVASYTPDLHRWLRIREQEGRVHYETSADGQTWSPLHSDTTPAFARSGRVILEAGTYKAETAPGVAVFDNLGLRSTEDWCPLSTLRDDFAAPELGLAWDPASASGCTIHVEAQTLVLETRGPVLCTVPSASVYLLDQSGISVELLRAPEEDSEASAGLALWSPVGLADFELSAFANDRVAIWDSAGQNYDTFTVVQPRLLRIYHDASAVHWEVLDGEGVRHRLYSLSTVEVGGPFFAILWLDCEDCTLDGTTPVRAVLDNLNR